MSKTPEPTIKQVLERLIPYGVKWCAASDYTMAVACLEVMDQQSAEIQRLTEERDALKLDLIALDDLVNRYEAALKQCTRRREG